MNTLKRFFVMLIIVGVFFTNSIFAADGLLFGEKDLRVVKTEWFDIIYPARSEKTAALLYQTADTIYEEVTAQYGKKPFVRFPVVITPATEQLNAFFTVACYNRIVLFDTSSSELDELSGSFSQGFLSIFRHELTHAVSYNLKDPLWNAVTKIIGDPAVLGYVFLSSGMAEGASVTSESAAGEGRLNNEFFRHRVKQAKLEGLFPSYFDMQGASDTYPSGAFYDFNAAFHLWLQEKYGMEKYTQFWEALINTKKLGVASCFKSVYGLKLKNAWKDFQADYSIPDIPANPVQAGLVSDFFEPSAAKYSSRNNYGARYSDLSISQRGLVWIEYSSGSVYFLPKENYGQPKKAKKLFKMRGLDGAILSADGNYLAVTYYSAASPNVSAGVKIYDMNTRTFFDAGVKGLKDGAIVYKDGRFYLVGQRYESPYNYIESYELIAQGNSSRIAGLKKVSSLQQPLFAFSGSFVDCGQGNFAYIQNDGLHFSICICDTDGKELARYPLADGTRAKQLSFSPEENALYFNWAAPGTGVRAARLFLDSGKTELSALDLSGGIFFPVSLEDKLVYTGSFFRQNRLLSVSKNVLFGAAEQALPTGQSPEFAASALFDMELDPNLALDSEKFNVFKYYTRGIFLPVSQYVSESFGENFGRTGTDYQLPFGITYITGNPWSNGSDGLFQLTAGWGAYTNSFGLSISAQGGSGTDLFAWQTSLGSEVDMKGWKQSLAVFSVSTAIPVGRISSISFSNSASGKIGRQNTVLPDFNQMLKEYTQFLDLFYAVGRGAPSSNTISYHVGDSFTASYSNIRSAGPGRFDYSGFALGAGLSYMKDATLASTPTVYQDALALTGIFRTYIPQLLPLKSAYSYTYHLPSKIEVAFFPSSSDYGYAASLETGFGVPVLDATFETVLFGKNIQKALPFFTLLFIHDFYFTAGYTGTWSSYMATKTGFQPLYLMDYYKGLADGSALYQDALFLKFAMEINPNVGMYANSGYKINITGGMKYSLHQLNEHASPFDFILELGASF